MLEMKFFLAWLLGRDVRLTICSTSIYPIRAQPPIGELAEGLSRYVDAQRLNFSHQNSAPVPCAIFRMQKTTTPDFLLENQGLAFS